MLAADLLVWTQVLAFTGQPARRWEPKRRHATPEPHAAQRRSTHPTPN
jgi:hypothetical protein